MTSWRPHILFVDDEETFREVTAAVLENMGYEVTAAGEAVEALWVFASDPMVFDVAIVDQVMPDLRGTDLVRKIREIRPDLPVILYVGYVDDALRLKAKCAGIKEIAQKPLTAEELKNLVERVLGTARSG